MNETLNGVQAGAVAGVQIIELLEGVEDDLPQKDIRESIDLDLSKQSWRRILIAMEESGMVQRVNADGEQDSNGRLWKAN